MGRTFDIVVTTFFGLEPVLETEIKALGVKHTEVLPRAVKFLGDKALLYKANLWLRTAVKVLIPIAEFTVNNEQELYQKAKMVDWESFFNLEQTFAIDGTTSGTLFTHSKYAALKLKDAIADQFRAKYNKRPNVDVDNPTVRFNVRIAQDKCTISLDSSGEPLTRRGYRINTTIAPLNEGLAAGLILFSGWDKKQAFIDPMCGSGTIAIEAALLATNTAPGLLRTFNFQNWSDYEEKLWLSIKEDAKQAIIETSGIKAFDNNLTALRAARENAERAGMKNNIQFELADFTRSSDEFDNAVAVMNPPYGERLNADRDISPFYKSIGTQLKQRFTNCKVWVLTSSESGMKSIGLRPSKRIKLFNGALECKFLGFDIYEGTKKVHKQKRPRIQTNKKGS